MDASLRLPYVVARMEACMEAWLVQWKHFPQNHIHQGSSWCCRTPQGTCLLPDHIRTSRRLQGRGMCSGEARAGGLVNGRVVCAVDIVAEFVANPVAVFRSDCCHVELLNDAIDDDAS
jgi:hypothetical protein